MSIKNSSTRLKNLCSMVLISFSGGFASCMQAESFHLAGTLRTITDIHVKSDIQGGIGGFKCVGDPNTIVASIQDCGGEQNVETIVYPYSGPIYAQAISTFSGEPTGVHSRIGEVDAIALLPASFLQLGSTPVEQLGSTVPWECDSCTISINGSVFRNRSEMPLNSLVYTGFGSIENPDAPTNISLRLGGCAGLEEISGAGPYANMVGTICVNGTLSIASDFTSVGGSACTVVLHDPSI
jgi:hypothetical protein